MLPRSRLCLLCACAFTCRHKHKGCGHTVRIRCCQIFREIVVLSENVDDKYQRSYLVSPSLLFLFCCSLSSSVILFKKIKSDTLWCVSFTQTHRTRQMNITSLNQCFFLAHQSYLHFLVWPLRCEMTDFCLAALQEETTQPRFKGTIFRGG